MRLGRLIGGGYGPEQEKTSMIGMQAKAVSNPTLRETLELQRVELERRLTEINEAIEALESHPEVLGVLEKLSKLGY